MQKLPVKIVTSVEIKQEWLDEVLELIPYATFEIEKVKKIELATWYNPYLRAVYGVWESMRSIVNAPASTGVRVRALIMSRNELRALGITNHLGLYDNADRDGVLDFYAGLPDRLDRRAAANGFSSNFAWLFIHEILHGKEQERGREYLQANGDRTHDMETEGKLKELLKEHTHILPQLEHKLGLLQMLLRKLLLLVNTVEPVAPVNPVPAKYRELVTQPYGVRNTRYPLTQHHIGTDYATPEGTALSSPWQGITTEVGYSNALGFYLHYQYTFKGQLYTMRLAHLRSMPTRGERKVGELLGYSGNTGQSTGAHTHVDVWLGDVNLQGITAANFRQRTTDPYAHFIG